MFGRIHRTQSVTLLWLAYRIELLNSVARWCNTTQLFHMLVCMGVGRIFFQAALVDFSKRFSRGGQKW